MIYRRQRRAALLRSIRARGFGCTTESKIHNVGSPALIRRCLQIQTSRRLANPIEVLRAMCVVR